MSPKNVTRDNDGDVGGSSSAVRERGRAAEEKGRERDGSEGEYVGY